jgi:hypothetical protein
MPLRRALAIAAAAVVGSWILSIGVFALLVRMIRVMITAVLSLGLPV